MNGKIYNKTNIFAKILRGEIPCTKVYEDNNVLAFYDKFPKAKIHVLVIPKAEFIDFDDFCKKSDPVDVGEFFKSVSAIAKNLCNSNDIGYKIITHNGAGGGQEVFHFHVHILITN